MNITNPITKVKTGVKSAINSPARFIVSLGVGFALGVIADLLMEAIVYYTKPGEGWGVLEVGFPFYYTKTITYIPYDDLVLLIATALMLFTKKFVLTLGFFLGWYISSCNGFYNAIVKTNIPEAP